MTPDIRRPPDRPANRLARETSPFLLQHAHNPVEWYPWGDEAFGARLLPAGKRRATLEAALRATFDEDLAGRILPFDSAAVPAYVDIVSARRAAGRPISQFDAQIAAVARHHSALLATRNVDDFEDCGVAVVNPWIRPA